MPSEASLPLATLYSFLLVLARISGAVVFAPIPGVSKAPAMARAMFALSLTMALLPMWPTVNVLPGPGLLTGWILSEAALGVAIGLVVGFLAEAFGVFGQTVGLQAGYSYVSTIDPNTQADSGILMVFAHTIAGLLFFATGLHREAVRAFAGSLANQPPGTFESTPAMADAIIRLGSTIFSTGLRLALPVVALLIMVDVALALLGRINAQLQLLTLAFPAKMLAGLALLTAMAALFPRVYSSYAARLFENLPRLTGQ